MTDKPGSGREDRFDDEAAVRRAYEALPSAEPPSHLDARILAEARRAAATGDRTVTKVQRWRTRTRLVALAATVVVAVPLAVSVFERQSPPDYPVEPDAASGGGAAAEDRRKAVAGAPEDRVPDRAAAEEFAPPPPVPSRRERLAEEAPAPGTRPAPQAEMPADANRFAAQRDAAADRDTPGRPDGGVSQTEAAMPYPVHPDESADQAATPDNEADRDPGLSGYAQAEAQFDAAPGATAPARARAGQADNETAGSPAAGEFAARQPPPRLPAAPAASQLMTVKGRPTDPAVWTDAIDGLVREGRIRAARVQLGRLLATYPDYRLPDPFPLAAADAIVPDDAAVVPDAGEWLRDIGKLAGRGRTDLARAELAEFLRRYPDYELPRDFPLTRADAAPIER